LKSAARTAESLHWQVRPGAQAGWSQLLWSGQRLADSNSCCQAERRSRL